MAARQLSPLDAGGCARHGDLLRPHRGPDRRSGFGVDLAGGAQAAGRGALDARTVVAEPAFEQIDVADEVGDPARIRLLVDFRRRRDLHEPAAIHDADAVGERHRFALVVGDDDEGQAEPALQLHQLELRFAAQLLVERRQRLVEQQQRAAA